MKPMLECGSVADPRVLAIADKLERVAIDLVTKSARGVEIDADLLERCEAIWRDVAVKRFKNCPLCDSPPVVHIPEGPCVLGTVSCSGKNDARCILQERYQDDANAHVTFNRWPRS